MKKFKILFVEDEQAIARALTVAFMYEGFETIAASNGKKGFAKSMRERPDLILLDIVMPKMDGIAMLKRIRQDGGDWGEQSR